MVGSSVSKNGSKALAMNGQRKWKEVSCYKMMKYVNKNE